MSGTWTTNHMIYLPSYGEKGATAFTSFNNGLRNINARLENEFSGTAGEDLTAYDLVYLKNDGKYWKSNANSSATMLAVAMATTNIAADATGTFTRGRRTVTNTGWSWATIGSIIYTSATTGGITVTAPAVSGYQVQVVGYVLSTTCIEFSPQLFAVEVP